MPTAGKVFFYRESLSFEQMYEKLNGYEYSEHDADFDLIKDITELKLSEKTLSGLYRYDSLVAQRHRSGLQIFPKTTDGPFLFMKEEDTTFLIIIAKKVVANNVANALSKILHGEVGAITESVVTPRAITDFYKKGEATKILLLDKILIPNMNKLTLYGENVVQTDLYGEYVNEGEPWYVVAKTMEGLTIGLVGDGSVTVFNLIDGHTFVNFIKDDIFPLILRRKGKDET